MSLSLTRRIARTALLIGAAAAPLLGVGAASAAGLPQAAAPGGLSDLDHGDVEDVTGPVGGVADRAGGKTLRTTGPATAKVLGSTGESVTPNAGNSVGRTAGTATTAVSGTTDSITTRGVPAGRLPLPGGLPIG